ncbi:MAG: hypothetical protein HYX53_02880 [Chloroflexi bacterium]|nr:hypothetical protein [Chloroflexota bacterium]
MADLHGLRRWAVTAFGQHWLPLLLLVAPIGLVVWSTGLESTPLLFVLPVAAFAIGFLLRPRHVWIIWLGAVVIQWAAMGVFGKYADPEDETVQSLILEAFAWMAIGVLLPVWLGRTIRRALRQGRRSGATPS